MTTVIALLWKYKQLYDKMTKIFYFQNVDHQTHAKHQCGNNKWQTDNTNHDFVITNAKTIIWNKSPQMTQNEFKLQFTF